MAENQPQETEEQRLRRKLGTPENREVALRATRDEKKRQRIIDATGDDSGVATEQ